MPGHGCLRNAHFPDTGGQTRGRRPGSDSAGEGAPRAGLCVQDTHFRMPEATRGWDSRLVPLPPANQRLWEGHREPGADALPGPRVEAGTPEWRGLLSLLRMSLASGNKYLVLTKRRALHTPGGTGRSLEHASHLLPASRWGRGHEDGAGPGAGRCTSRQLTQLSPGTDSFVRGRRREGCPSVRLSVCNSVSTREEEVCQNMKKVKR